MKADRLVEWRMKRTVVGVDLKRVWKSSSGSSYLTVNIKMTSAQKTSVATRKVSFH